MIDLVLNDKGEMIAQMFLYNNEMNDAGDPINFQIHSENNDKIAKSFIGRPYLLPEKDKQGKWINRHFRTDNLNELFIKQKKFAAGEIIATPYNILTGNYNAQIKVFPEYYDIFRKKNFQQRVYRRRYLRQSAGFNPPPLTTNQL